MRVKPNSRVRSRSRVHRWKATRCSCPSVLGVGEPANRRAGPPRGSCRRGGVGRPFPGAGGSWCGSELFTWSFCRALALKYRPLALRFTRGILPLFPSILTWDHFIHPSPARAFLRLPPEKTPPFLSVFAMHFQPLLAGLALFGVAQAGFYPKSSPVLQVDAKNYDSLIAKSNYTSVRPPLSLQCSSSSSSSSTAH